MKNQRKSRLTAAALALLLAALWLTPLPASAQTRIRITLGGRQVYATLGDGAAARSLVGQLPLTLAFQDYAGVEKIAYPPQPLDTSGAPSGYDPSRGDLAYYAPWGNLVVYYGQAGYASGLVKLGQLAAGGAQAFGQMDGPFTATLEVDPGDPSPSPSPSPGPGAPDALAILPQGELRLGPGEAFQLTASLSPQGSQAQVRWRSSKPRIAQVSQEGLVTARRKGAATITARTEDGLTASLRLRVAPIKVTAIAIQGQAQMAVGQTQTLTAQILPENATDQGLRWSSSHPKTASVGRKTGLLRARRPGIARITARAKDGSAIRAAFTVTVVSAEN